MELTFIQKLTVMMGIILMIDNLKPKVLNKHIYMRSVIKMGMTLFQKASIENYVI